MAERSLKKKLYNDRMYYFMFFPVFVLTVIFCYAPMVGIIYSFFDKTPYSQVWVGLQNFKDLFVGIYHVQFWNSLRNTLFLSIINLILATVVSVAVALLLNELSSQSFRGFVQTILYLPHFMSWVVVASIFTIILSPQGGFFNNIRGLFGASPLYYLAEDKYWTPVYLFIARWKDTGWGTIIYLAAMSGINPELYEAAEMDGAGRWKQAWSITIPSISVTIMTVFILNLGKVLNIFESVFALMNPNVRATADVIATFAYRIGIEQGQYGMGTAIGLFKSLVGLALVLMTDEINKRIKGSSLL